MDRNSLWIRSCHEGKKDLLVQEINRYKWDIIGLSETHLPVTGFEKIRETALFLSSRNDGIYCQGARFILLKKAEKSFISTTPVFERIIAIQLKGLTANLSLIQAYVPDFSRS
ncbi:hypothetical protein QYM36_019795, partial [Artemia franciscana]